MNYKICTLLIAAFSLQFPVSLCCCASLDFCPDFTATFVAVIDQVIDAEERLISDPEETFFRNDLGFRDDDVQHVFENAIKFFNETYGLDFSESQPNEQNEYVLENAKMDLFRFHEYVRFRIVFNNWIQTGNTRTTCNDAQIGGYRAIFTKDQIVHGTYGGVDGIPVKAGDFMVYGYHILHVCSQSPVIIQAQSASPIRQVPVEAVSYLDVDVYNQVLGYGKAIGTVGSKPDPDFPGEFRLVARVVYTFPAN